MLSHNKTSVTWIDADNPLGAGANRYVEIGMPGSGQVGVNLEKTLFLTWSFIASQATTIDIEVMYSGIIPPVWYVYITQNALAATMTTPYNLAAPYNNTGFVIVPAFHMRIHLTDTSGIAHAYTRFFARAWWS